MQSLSCHGFRRVFGQELVRFWSKLVQDALEHLQNRDWSLLIARRWCLESYKMAPRWYQIRLSDHMAAKTEHWSAPGHVKEDSRWSQDHLRRARGGPRGPQEGSMSAQTGSGWDQRGPESRQSVPKNLWTLHQLEKQPCIKILRVFSSKLKPGMPR